MKIAVIAANGRSGKQFTEAALAAGHKVRAGVHKEHNLSSHPNLKIVECDASNKAQLSRLVTGQEAVASFIGHVKGSDSMVQTVVIRNVVQVMTELGIRRIISLTGTGVRFTGDRITAVDKILNLGIRLIDPNRIRDGIEHVEVLKNSKLDWTVIRVLKLQNVTPTPFILNEHGPTKAWVGRKEVAQAVLQVLEQRSFVKKAPIICNS